MEKTEQYNIPQTSKYCIRKDFLLEKKHFLITIWKSMERLHWRIDKSLDAMNLQQKLLLSKQ